jgi:hypothetical protein
VVASQVAYLWGCWHSHRYAQDLAPHFAYVDTVVVVNEKGEERRSFGFGEALIIVGPASGANGQVRVRGLDSQVVDAALDSG